MAAAQLILLLLASAVSSLPVLSSNITNGVMVIMLFGFVRGAGSSSAFPGNVATVN